jgi:chromatin remodeling complex protein RSC6
MIVQKLLIDAVVKAIGKKSKKKADDIIEKIDRLFSITQNLAERIKRLEDASYRNKEIEQDK